MPITAIYSKKFIKAARDAEGLTVGQASAILRDAPQGWLKTLTDHLADADFAEGEGLPELRAKFPLLIPADDVAASFLIRIAVGEAGGLAL